jgi:arylsulfatase A-like enzyme
MIRKGPWKYIRFTWYSDLLFNLDEDPGELHDRSKDPDAQGVLRELRAILDSQVDSEAVTRSGFLAQEKVLAKLARQNSEAGLAKVLEGRMGEGLARVLAVQAKRQFG